MKNRKKNHFKLWTIGIMAILLLATPSGWAGDYNDGGTYDITIDEYYLNINTGPTPVPGTTVNLYANIVYIVVGSSSFLNIYSGEVGYIAVSTDSPSGIVTVYGTDFSGVNLDFSVQGQVTFPDGFGILKGDYGDGSAINLMFFSDGTPVYLQPPVSEENDELIIDVKPGSDENVINLKSKGVVPVAVLTTDEFDAVTLVPDYSISFAGASPVHSTLCDVDDDGDEDMLFHFRTQELVELNENSVEATLTATLKSAVTRSSSVADADGDVIYGTDKVKIKSSGKK